MRWITLRDERPKQPMGLSTGGYGDRGLRCDPFGPATEGRRPHAGPCRRSSWLIPGRNPPRFTPPRPQLCRGHAHRGGQTSAAKSRKLAGGLRISAIAPKQCADRTWRSRSSFPPDATERVAVRGRNSSR